MADFRTELVKAAKGELARFGGRNETDPSVDGLLMEYWTTGAGRGEKAAKKEITDRTAWSAAFISFVVKKALATSGSKAKFEFSGSHSEYAGAATRNLLEEVPFPAFYGIAATGVGAGMPELGDIIGVTRTKSIDDYADVVLAARNHETYFSHFDIVTELAAGSVKAIGGNVKNSVTEKTIKLVVDGFLPNLPFKLDSAGAVLSGPFICMIKHRE